MAFKQIDGEHKKTLPKFRLIFILALIGIGLFLGSKFQKKPDTKVLGEKTAIKPQTIDLNKDAILEQLKLKESDFKVIAKSTGTQITQLAATQVQQAVQETASKSAEVATDFVFQNTVGKLLEQINKLPEKQQEEVRAKICK